MSSTSTAIEWTDKTWNPTTGCNKVSPGCKHCYAETITKRFPQHFPNGFEFTLRPDRLDEPRHWRKPSRVFVNSMSDLFHERMPFDFLQDVFRVMEECPRHVFQILTKRHERLLELAPELEWPENVWMGVSVENQDYAHRVDYLRKVPAAVRFLSCEPLASRSSSSSGAGSGLKRADGSSMVASTTRCQRLGIITSGGCKSPLSPARTAAAPRAGGSS